ncbi:tRNA preQ1(34) S-adenosylmethionine ribosyltransferase-isomerase QueA [bacterium]|nr:tRNA preQ1(34) S-adenosylmethionine ribosyltransferase-isomerase QueA [bacterium]
MKLNDFNYHLPPSLIAQVPSPERERSRLMVLHRESRLIEHRQFPDIVGYLRKGDALVLNDSKVIPARLLGASPHEGEKGSKGEVLLLEEMAKNLWECLVKPGKQFLPGSEIFFSGHGLVGEVVADTPFGSKIIRFRLPGDRGKRRKSDLRDWLDEIGCVPLPPYIKRKKILPDDQQRYQTVYASKDGSVAAPTAGFHFTDRLLKDIRQKGIGTHFVTLHVGLGTFQPVRTQEVERHRMHAEWFSIEREAAEALNGVRRAGGRIVAVGTTAARALETAADWRGTIRPLTGKTGLFIYPGYTFKTLEKGALLTNFHLPRSTLLMLVCAFAGTDFILEAYQQAIQMGYRFYSYGDAMLIL